MTLPAAGFLLLCAALMTGSLRAGETTFQSGPARAHLLELFTSEGCSSCPPAERWFSTLRQSDRLWKEVVPVAFHVDYWDSLGWTDPFASRTFTNRQRAYAAAWRSNSIYTPEFVLNGAEWRDRALTAIPAAAKDAGTLSVTVRTDGGVELVFAPAKARSGRKWRANAAVLGLEITSNVKAGENGGRTLVHDFVALSHQSAAMTGADPRFVSSLKVTPGELRPGHTALAAWVTEDGSVEPVQATGGNL